MAIDIRRGPGAAGALTSRGRMGPERLQPAVSGRQLGNPNQTPICERAMPPEPLNAFAYAQRLERRLRSQQAKLSEVVPLIEDLVEQNQRLHRALLDTLALLVRNSGETGGNDVA
jgi:hypothetical protein